MIHRSVKEYTYAHARIRGRIGDMPGEGGWQKILNAGDLETTIESMSASGLHYWVSDFPRHPSTDEIERGCLVSLLGIYLFVNSLLPHRWKDTGQWLLHLPHVLQLRAVQSANMDKKQLLPGSPFLNLMSLAPRQRSNSLQEGDYALYLDEHRPAESAWVARFEHSLPILDAQERHTLKRLSGLLEEHYRGIDADMASEQQWIERARLFDRLKALMAGNPFQIGILLIYAVLESIQFERIRAVLLLRAYQWPASLLGGLV